MAVARGRPPLVPKKSSGGSMWGASRSKQQPSSSTQSIGRRRSSSSVFAYDDDFFRSMAELDETVASISGDSTSSSVQGSISTDCGHNVLTSRHAMIGNMEQVKKDHSLHRRSRSVSSRRSSNSRRSKRGSSLERSIDRTIRSSYDLDSEHVHANLARSPSTEEILKDLYQADAILCSETGSLLPPIAFDDEPNLLPPAADEWDWQPRWEDSFNNSDSTNDTDPTNCFEDHFGAWPAFDDDPAFPNNNVPSIRPDPVGSHWDESLERFNSSFAFSAPNFDPTVITDFSLTDNPFADKRSSPACVAEGPWF